MDELRNMARGLLESGEAAVVIGWAEGTPGRRRAHFARKPEECLRLVLDDACVQGLVAYLYKPEVKVMGRVAVVVRPNGVRALLQLAAENQLADGAVMALAVSPDGKVQLLKDFASMEAFVAQNPGGPSERDIQLLNELSSRSEAERWAFWKEELSRCVKCYACRSSCPMCYCDRCVVDCNQPQWVSVAPHLQGNLEWHMVRAMHLAGRCVECGECGRACPVGIPIHLFTLRASRSVAENFGDRAGTAAQKPYALSSFQPEDRETFIR